LKLYYLKHIFAACGILILCFPADLNPITRGKPQLLLLQHLFNGLCSRTTWVSWYQKGKTSLDLNEARDNGGLGCSGIIWTLQQFSRYLPKVFLCHPVYCTVSVFCHPLQSLVSGYLPWSSSARCLRGETVLINLTGDVSYMSCS